MESSLAKENSYEFSVFRLDTVAGVLSVDGRPVKIAPKVLRCLTLLVEARGAIVSKERFFEVVWTAESKSESVLSYTLSQLRKTLAKYDPETEFIETFSKRGTRFKAEVATSGGLERANFGERIVDRRVVEEVWIEEFSDIDQPLALPAADTRRWWPRLALLGVAIVAVLGYVGYYFGRTTGRPEIRSVAILPPKEFSQSPEDPTLQLRIMDSLVSRLGRIPTLSVRPTSATSKYVGSSDDPVAIARNLGVDAVLDGRIQREGRNMRLTVQLIMADTGEQVWADQFDGRDDRSLDLQDAVASRLASFFGREYVEGKGPSTRKPAAFEEYLTGRYFWQKRTKDGIGKAIEAFQRAIAIDPNFAEAYAGLADSYYVLVDYSYDTSPLNLDLARQNLDVALKMNPDLVEALVTRARIEATTDWNWSAAESTARRAIAIEPNDPTAHHRLGMILLSGRRFDEGEAELRRARELDPTSPSINMNLGVTMLAGKKFVEAKAQLARTIELDPQFVGPKWYYHRCLRLLGEVYASQLVLAEAIELDGDRELAEQVRELAKSGGEAEVLRAVQAKWKNNVGPTGLTPFDLACLAMLLGEQDVALEWIEKSVEQRHPWSPAFNYGPEFDDLRGNVRFQELIKRMNFD